MCCRLIFWFLAIVPLLAEASREVADCGQIRSGAPELGALLKIGDSLGDQILQLGSPGEPARETAIYGNKTGLVYSDAIYPVTAIGRLTTETGWCTATLVSACHLVSAAHCATRKDGTLMDASSLEWQRSLGGPTSQVSAFEAGRAEGNPKLEYLFLRLENSPGRKSGYFTVLNADGREVEAESRAQNGRIVVSGYSQDIHDGHDLSYDDRVNVWSGLHVPDENKNYLYYNATTAKGASGGPIWYFNEPTRTAVLLGINTQAILTGDGKQVNLPLLPSQFSDLARGVAAGAFYEELRRFEREHPCQP